jgi:hypothetical protein
MRLELLMACEVAVRISPDTGRAIAAGICAQGATAATSRIQLYLQLAGGAGFAVAELHACARS